MKNEALLKTLCELSGVSGYETDVLHRIESEIAPFCDELYYDRIGNLIAFKKGLRGSVGRVLYSCHADEVGFVITHIEEDGTLRFDEIGMHERVFCGRKVLIGKEKIAGILATKPAHLVKGDEREKIPPCEEMYIDIGAKSRAEAEESGVYADYAVFDSPFVRMGETTYKAKAIDDRIGCYLLCEKIKGELLYDSYFAFCVGEELGLRGSPVVARSLCPDLCINVECTTAGDLPDVTDYRRTCTLGGGVTLPFMDGASIYTPALYRAAVEFADRKGIRTQTKTAVAGGTDAGAYQRAADCGILGIALPARYIHSANSLFDVRDVQAAERLVFEIEEILPSLVRLSKGEMHT